MGRNIYLMRAQNVHPVSVYVRVCVCVRVCVWIMTTGAAANILACVSGAQVPAVLLGTLGEELWL